MGKLKCKDCGKTRNHNNSLISRCKECTYNRSIANPKQNTLQAQKPMKKTRLKQVSSKNKNTIAKFTQKTKDEILERDGHKCIICEGFQNYAFDFHHCYFGANSNRGSNRNDADQGVTLCQDCHTEIHHGITGKGKLYRAKCIEYILKLK